MRLPASDRARFALVVAIGVLALVALNLWWVVTYRHGYPLDVDEAGYTSIGLADYLGLRGGGLHGWWEAVQQQTPNAPLVPALTSLVLTIKTGIHEGFVVLIGFLALLTFAAYGIGERLAGARLGALAALVVATSPGAFVYTREYIFALPAAALLACAAYGLLRSDGLRVRRWSVAAGVALGLMLLARTMAVAFVPGVFVAGIVCLVARHQEPGVERNNLASRLLNLGLMALAAAAVAATWYVRNLQPVIDYLTSYGYGAQSSQYGTEHSVVSWSRWRAVAERMTFDDLLVPLAALMLLGLIVLVVVAVRRVVDADDRRTAVLRLVGSDAFSVAIVFAAGYVALTSSQNGGNGFTFPLAVLLPPLAVVALRHVRSAAIPAVALVSVITAVNIAASSDLWANVSRLRLVDVPGFGSLPWINGVPHAVGAIRAQVPGPEARFDGRDRGWQKVDRTLAARLVQPIGPGGQQPVVAFASRNRVISTNSVGLAALLYFQRGIPFAQLSAEPSDTVSTYVDQLTDPRFGLPSVLITMSRNTADFPPLVTQRYAETAARRVGFRKTWAMTLPDGRRLRVWMKQPRLSNHGAMVATRRPARLSRGAPTIGPRGLMWVRRSSRGTRS